MWKIFISVEFRKDSSLFFLLHQLNFSKQRSVKVCIAKQNYLYKEVTWNFFWQQARASHCIREEKAEMTQIKSGSMCPKQTVLILSAVHMPPRWVWWPWLKTPKWIVSFFLQPQGLPLCWSSQCSWGHKIALLSTHSYTVVDQEWPHPLQSETGGKCPSIFQDACTGLQVPCQHPSIAIKAELQDKPHSPSLLLWVHWGHAHICVCFPDCSIKPLNPVSSWKWAAGKAEVCQACVYNKRIWVFSVILDEVGFSAHVY